MSVLLLGGSPSASSSGARLLQHVGDKLALLGHRCTKLQVRDLPAQALLHADFGDPAIARATALVLDADAIVIVTPVYKASYTGILKAFLDLLPQDGLDGKLVLPLATGGSQSHMLVLDYALRPVLASLAARAILPGIYATSEQLSGAPKRAWCRMRRSRAASPRAWPSCRPNCCRFQRIGDHARKPRPSLRNPSLRTPLRKQQEDDPPKERRNARRQTLGLLFAGIIAAGLTPATHAQASKEVRIGYQKYGTLTLLKGRGTWRSAWPQRHHVKWTEFPAGPQLLEGLNVGGIDFGTIGEAPPIFAQAAGAQPGLRRQRAAVAGVRSDPGAQGSAIRKRGRPQGQEDRAQQGLERALPAGQGAGKGGLDYKRHAAVFLPPADARAAFERGAVDAWVIWDPFLAAAEQQRARTMLADGKWAGVQPPVLPGLAPYRRANPETVEDRDRGARPRSTNGAAGTRERSRRSWPPRPAWRRRRGAGGQALCLRRQAGHAAGDRRAAEDRRRVPRLEADPESRSSSRTHSWPK